MNAKWFFGLVALIALAGIANAAIYIGYADSDYRFEIYSGSAYHYVATPYTYVYSDYYYFDYPFRYYSAGNYYYFQPGWYAFDDYWRFAPDYVSYYTYYPADYYYYGGAWNYYPGWMSVYGPTYYGAYYYPPYSTFQNTYYYQNLGGYAYNSGAPSLVGQHYQPVQEASCGQAKLETQSVSLAKGQNKEVTFYVDNFSGKYFDVANANVYVDSFDIKVREVRFDKTVRNGAKGKIMVEFGADDDASGAANATLSVSGTFRDGTFCSSSDLKKNFTVSISGSAQNSNSNAALYSGGAYYNVQGSYAYNQARETQQQWQDVSPSTTQSNTRTTYTQPNYVRDITNENNYPAGTIGTYYGEAQFVAQSCANLSVSKENIVVDSGESTTGYFTFRNYSGEDFYIDAVDTRDYSSALSVEAWRESSIVFSTQTTAIKVKVNAIETESDEEGTAYITVKGHYKSGLDCEIASETFYVRVNGSEEEASLAQLKIDNPSSAQLPYGSGFVSFSFDNPSNKSVRLKVYSPNANVSEQEFTIAANSAGERTIAVNGLRGEEGIIYFDADSGSGTFLKKYSRLVRTEPSVNTAPAHPASNGEAQDDGAFDDVTGFIATGFSFLADNAALLGAVLIVLIVVIVLSARL